MVEDKSSTMIFKFYVNIEFWFITYHHFCAYLFISEDGKFIVPWESNYFPWQSGGK